MTIVYLLSWWYSTGIKEQLHRGMRRLASVFDYFSIDILIKTLFAPFRQISSGRVRGGLDVQFRAFVDRLISRLIGGFVRFFTIIIGLSALLLTVVILLISLIIWLVIPLAPIAGLIAMLGGWVPWSL